MIKYTNIFPHLTKLNRSNVIGAVLQTMLPLSKCLTKDLPKKSVKRRHMVIASKLAF